MRRGRLLLAERDRGLVAVVAVGDQERRVELELAGVEPPEARAHAALVDLHLRRALRHGDGRVGVVEQEDRLELRAGRAEEGQPVLACLRMRQLVPEHVALGVRRRLDRAGDALARAHLPVGPDELLPQPPERRLLLAQDAALPPGRQLGRGRLRRVRPRQVDDVPVARVPERVEQVVVDDVVGRRDQVVEGPGDRLVVAERAKRRDPGHGLRLAA